MSDENNDQNIDINNIIKLILVGDSGTGKTNLINVAAGFDFDTGTVTTTSCSYVQKIMKKDNEQIKINLWDTIGQEKYRSLTKIFVKDSKIVIFVYDITKKESFDSLKYWKKVVEDVLGKEAILGVVGNKIDLYLEEQVSEDEGREYANLIGAKFKLTSAKNAPNSVIEIIEQLVNEYLEKNKNNKERRSSVKLKKMGLEKKKKCC